MQALKARLALVSFAVVQEGMKRKAKTSLVKINNFVFVALSTTVPALLFLPFMPGTTFLVVNCCSDLLLEF